ncbi:acyl-CoA dehydrogenase family protein [Streptomyces sp. NPDC059371]|uniref:acyl-CoA dehydrogenase family protein n=1 Tax=Streptomyces sp. NPDC059371 TaxID=3346812 RepID=UPI0036AAACFD
MSHRTSLSAVLVEVVAPAAELTAVEGRFPRDAVSAFGRAGLLGLTVPRESGGAGLGLSAAADVVARTARVCPATAAVLASHFAAVAAIESCGGSWVREEVAAGRHLAGLALDEDPYGATYETTYGTTYERSYGKSRSVAARFADVVALRGRKHQVVAAGEADSYLWSSRPLAGRDGLTLWVVPAQASDLFVPARSGGGGPRGSATSTLHADPVLVPADVMLGPDGGGLDVLLCTVRPWLLELTAAAAGAFPGSGPEPNVLRSGGRQLRPGDEGLNHGDERLRPGDEGRGQGDGTLRPAGETLKPGDAGLRPAPAA